MYAKRWLCEVHCPRRVSLPRHPRPCSFQPRPWLPRCLSCRATAGNDGREPCSARYPWEEVHALGHPVHLSQAKTAPRTSLDGRINVANRDEYEATSAIRGKEQSNGKGKELSSLEACDLDKNLNHKLETSPRGPGRDDISLDLPDIKGASASNDARWIPFFPAMPLVSANAAVSNAGILPINADSNLHSCSPR